MKIDVLSIGSFPEATNTELAQRFAVTRYLQRPSPDALGADLKNRVRGVATEANRGADRALIAALPKLEVIAVFGVGTDAVDLAAARERNIPVTNTPRHLGRRGGRPRYRPDACVSAADPVRGSLRARRQLGQQRSDPARPQRRRQDHGRARAGRHRPRHRRARPRLAHARDLQRAAPQTRCALRIRRRSGRAGAAQRLSHDRVQGRSETRHLVSAAVIDALGPEGTLVNVARGSVVDERALAAALAEGRLGYAALDVFESAPNPSPELLQLPNVIVQPHHGSATVETRTAIGRLMIDNLSAHFAGRPLLTPVL